jgi:hypothetical protein
MRHELVFITKPKHKNVLMVHGMYANALKPALSA